MSQKLVSPFTAETADAKVQVAEEPLESVERELLSGVNNYGENRSSPRPFGV